MSALITWSEQLATDIPDIDGHHKGLVALLNTLHENVHRRRGVAACRESVEKLRRYALAHFAVEANLMAIAGYEGWKENLEAQQALTGQLDEMLERMDETSSNITFYGLYQLKVLVLRHIHEGVESMSAPLVRGGQGGKGSEGSESLLESIGLKLKRA